MNVLRSLAAMMLCAGLGACEASANSGGISSGGATLALPADFSPSISWEPCDSLWLTVAEDITSECATVQVPVRWDRPDGPTIDYFLRRLRPQEGPVSARVWLLEGGPGQEGTMMVGVAELLLGAGARVEAIVPDHRGTGSSQRLECALAEAWDSEGGKAVLKNEGPGCVAELVERWGEDLAGFSTSDAALDVAAVEMALRAEAPGARTFVFGSSYGTYLALRVAMVAGVPWDGVALDSACPPGACDFAVFDDGFDGVGRAFLKRCGTDAVCAAHLPGDAEQRLKGLYSKLATGHCPAAQEAGFSVQTTRRLLSSLLANEGGRLLIAPLLLRLDRCNQADQLALAHAAEALGIDKLADQSAHVPLAGHAPSLYFNIVFSELWLGPTPSEDAAATADKARLFTAEAAAWLVQLKPLWPAYPRPPSGSTLPFLGNGTPVLVMQGTLDPQTPYGPAAALQQRMGGAQVRLVSFTDGVHGALFAGASGFGTASTGMDAPPTCGFGILLTFLAEPHATLPDGCAANASRVDFGLLSAEVGEVLMGTGDVWDGAPTPIPGDPLMLIPDWLERLRRVVHDDLVRPGG